VQVEEAKRHHEQLALLRCNNTLHDSLTTLYRMPMYDAQITTRLAMLRLC
jgi:hypothetical protein